MATKKYLFLPDKTFLKQGFFMKDENDTVIYEAKMTKFSLFGAFEFEFFNHKTGKMEKHKVGHTLTSSQSGMLEMLSIKSRFKYDGQNIWDYLHDLGIRIDSHLSSNKIGMIYNVTFKGKEFATIATSSPKGKSIITSSYCYDVTCDEENIDLAFLVTFAIARTEQIAYN